MINLTPETEQRSISELEHLLTGPQTIEEVLNEAILREAERRGLEKGMQLVQGEIEEDVKRYIRQYTDSLFQLSLKTYERISRELPSVKITDFKTHLQPFSQELNLFVIIEETDIETEIKVGLILAAIEREFLVSNNIFCEILYARKGENLDIAAVKRDYPFSLRIPNA